MFLFLLFRSITQNDAFQPSVCCLYGVGFILSHWLLPPSTNLLKCGWYLRNLRGYLLLLLPFIFPWVMNIHSKLFSPIPRKWTSAIRRRSFIERFWRALCVFSQQLIEVLYRCAIKGVVMFWAFLVRYFSLLPHYYYYFYLMEKEPYRPPIPVTPYTIIALQIKHGTIRKARRFILQYEHGEITLLSRLQLWFNNPLCLGLRWRGFYQNQEATPTKFSLVLHFSPY